MAKHYLVLFCFKVGLVCSLTPSIEIFEPASRKIDFHLTQPGTLICKINDRQGHTVRWFHQPAGKDSFNEISRDFFVHIPSRYSIDKVSSRSKLWRLTIRNVRIGDTGVYSCRLYLSTQSFIEQRLTASVVQKPIIDSSSSTPMVTLQEGDPAELRCVSHGLPPPVIAWSRSGGEALPGGGAFRIGTTLTITSVTPDDRGIYVCNARNKAGEAQRRINVDVLFEPVLTSERLVYRQARGYDRELSCYVEANPVVSQDQVSWSRNGQTLKRNNKHILTFLKGGLNKVTWKLYIRDVSSSDYGGYTCSAWNGQDNKQTIRSLTVQLAESSEFVAGVGQVISGTTSSSQASFCIISALAAVLYFL